MKAERRVAHRLLDILDAIGDIRAALTSETRDSFLRDRIRQAAVKLCFVIISDASRHVPDEIKIAEPTLRWRMLADLGDSLVQGYYSTNAAALWNICEDQLGKLEEAIRRAQPNYPPIQAD